MEQTLPQKQYAIQLVGPDELKLNSEKDVYQPGPHQILAKVEAVGLCFSDLKLLKQFDLHARKSEVLSGAEASVLSEVPSYKPNTEPTVPGHEAYGVIVAVGDKVRHHHAGQKVLIQTDYRWLKTAASNAAFGYNFEGALQEYVLMDERVIVDPNSDESFLIPVEKDLSASAIALVEPWACVESSYVTEERNAILAGGKLLVVTDAGHAVEGLAASFATGGKPAAIVALCADAAQKEGLNALGVTVTTAQTVDALPNEGFDDIVYFGRQKATIEVLNDKLAARGIINIVLGGQTIGQDVSVGVGRTHYGLTRWIGTPGSNAADSYENIPATGELRSGDTALVVGAAGPMGQMHVIRLICSGVDGISIVGTDFDDERLASLNAKAAPLAEDRGVKLSLVNPKTNPINEKFSYFAIMAPVGPLVAQAVKDSTDGAIINIFAGIPATVKQDLDLDTYIANRCFMFGTSGSRLSDMKIVLNKVVSGQLDTNCSVDAVCGMAGAIDGIRAVENRTLAGKIIVYPQLKELPLTPLEKLAKQFPAVAEKMDNGIWTQAAEAQLLSIAH
ncbi:MAG: alcohol dehydrogenase catalytic domain-containing protein [Phycisphaerae bacterium]|nr:alcohol dehydrogenase catalytic domain-containing protein [Phycisphaerae bacterium]